MSIFKVLRSAVGYIRVSLKGDDAQDSVDEQRKSIERYAEDHDLEIVEWYVDEGSPGGGVERSTLQELLIAARSQDHGFDAVLVWEMSQAERQ